MVINGTCFDVPDSDENARVFDRPSSRPGTQAHYFYRFTGTLRVIRRALPKFQRLNSEEFPLFLPG